MVHVIFKHDDDVKKWEIKVVGTTDPIEARQAFSAVVLTCKELPVSLLTKTKVIRDYMGKNPDLFEIIPCIGEIK